MNPSRGSRAKLIAGGLVACIPPALVVLAWLFPAIDSQFVGIATGASIFACAMISGFLIGFALGRAPDGQIAIGFVTAGLLVLLYFLGFYVMVSMSGAP